MGEFSGYANIWEETNGINLILEDAASKNTVMKALKVEEPNIVNNYTDETIENNKKLLNYAISIQKKEVIKSDEEESQVAILKDLEDKFRRWDEFDPEEEPKPLPPKEDDGEEEEAPEEDEKDSEEEEEPEEEDDEEEKDTKDKKD